jgi:hypothetical protein
LILWLLVVAQPATLDDHAIVGDGPLLVLRIERVCPMIRGLVSSSASPIR